MYEYRFGDLKTFPISVFNKMCPVLSKEDDYTIYDDEIRKKIENIQDEKLKFDAITILLDPSKFTTVRKTRNIHNFRLLGKLSTVSQDEFNEFVKRYVGLHDSTAIYDIFELPIPFLWSPKDDDNYPYFD